MIREINGSSTSASVNMTGRFYLYVLSGFAEGKEK